MIVTVEVAKTKQCRSVPLVLIPKSGGTLVGRQEAVYTAAQCVGPECMAWQWAHKVESGEQTGYCGFLPR